MMIYELTTRAEMHGIIEYEHDLSVDPTLFLENFSLAGLTGELIYTVKKKSDIKKLEKFHMLGSGGPMLISDQLREVIEQNIVDEAEFFRAKVLYKDEEINGFSAINIVHAVSCINMDKSEYEQMNFDAADPEYDFSYTYLKTNSKGNSTSRLAVSLEDRLSLPKLSSLRAPRKDCLDCYFVAQSILRTMIEQSAPEHLPNRMDRSTGPASCPGRTQIGTQPQSEYKFPAGLSDRILTIRR